MSKRIGIFVDASNLYFCTRQRLGAKVNYSAFKKYFDELGDVVQAIIYGSQMHTEAEPFIHAVTALGFTCKYKKPKEFKKSDKRKADWDVGICMDIVQMVDRLDIVVLGSADGDMAPLCEWCTRRGVKVIVFACGISFELRNVATCIEIPPSILETSHESRDYREDAETCTSE